MAIGIITILDLKCNPIFKQIRTVDGSSEFVLYKFRSMKKSAPIIPTSMLQNPQCYMTKWTKFMRLYSLDELLNVVNIIRGDMKFIGPRPIMPNEIDLINLRCKNNIRSKAGITGLAQINGRDFVTLTKKVACERYFQSNKSIGLEFYIILRTVWLVLGKAGVSH